MHLSGEDSSFTFPMDPFMFVLFTDVCCSWCLPDLSILGFGSALFVDLSFLVFSLHIKN
jgi:hypothetical protein